MPRLELDTCGNRRKGVHFPDVLRERAAVRRGSGVKHAVDFARDEPGKVLEVFQKGYRVKDKIIRYAMVKVSVE